MQKLDGNSPEDAQPGQHKYQDTQNHQQARQFIAKKGAQAVLEVT